ncbi:MAG: AhpC/TSA family protein [Burkholderiaceae bacterium]|nr:AhpC/TSA family protein [Microbacteriaceae bacterium]
MATAYISDQVDEFNQGFSAQIGPDLSAVFDREQLDLTSAGVPAGSVAVGDVVSDAELVGLDGATVSLFGITAGRPAVLVFYRGAWCPYCNITLRTYERELRPELDRLGVALVAISPQTPDGSTAAVKGGELNFPVLSDPSNALVRALGILTAPSGEARAAHTALGFDVADSNADSTADIPFPTVLIVDAHHTVRFVGVHVDYTTRTEVPAILAALA